MRIATSSLHSNAVWMAAALGIQALAQALAMLLIGHMGNPEALGTYSYAMALVVPILMATNLGLRSQLLSDVSRSATYANYQLLRWMGLVIGGLVIGASLLWMHVDALVVWVTLCLGCVKMAEYYADLTYGYWQREEQHKKIALSTFYRNLAGLVGLGLGFWLHGDFLTGIFGMACGSIFAVLIYDVPLLRTLVSTDERTWQSLSFGKIRQLTYLGIPLAASSFVNSFNVSIPRLLMVSYWGMAVMGQLAVYLYSIQVLSMGAQAIGHTLGPRMAKYYYQKDKAAFLRLWKYGFAFITLIGLISGLGIVLWGDLIIGVVFGKDFVLSSPFSLYFGVAGIFILGGAIQGFFMTAIRAFWTQLPIQVVSLLLTVVLSYGLLPMHGVMAVPLILGAPALFLTLAMGVVIWQRLKAVL